jgi:hypothetical protein
MDLYIQVFRTGKHVDASGQEKEWRKEDLDRIVYSYNPQGHEAPVVIGHPKENAPAYGWVAALKREGEVLYANLKNLVPEFVDMVKKGLFKKRSISLYPDLTLRHVGFLGAMPPAIKGLEDIKFQGRDQTTISFSDFEDNLNFEEGEAEMSKQAQAKNDMERELQRRINEVLRNPPGFDKRGNKFSEKPTYREAFNYVMEEDPDLAQRYAESIRPRASGRFQNVNEAAGKKIVDLVEAKMRSDKALSFGEALIKVQLENPQLIREYLIPDQIRIEDAHRRAMDILKDPSKAGKYAEGLRENLSYRQALEIVLQQDPELAGRYAGGFRPSGEDSLQREIGQAATNVLASLAKKEKEGDGTLSFSEALKRVHKKNPHLVAFSQGLDLPSIAGQIKIIAGLARDLLAADPTLTKIEAIIRVLEDDPGLARDLTAGGKTLVL